MGARLVAFVLELLAGGSGDLPLVLEGLLKLKDLRLVGVAKGGQIKAALLIGLLEGLTHMRQILIALGRCTLQCQLHGGQILIALLLTLFGVGARLVAFVLELQDNGSCSLSFLAMSLIASPQTACKSSAVNMSSYVAKKMSACSFNQQGLI